MTARIEQMTSFGYTTYIHATPDQVWRGLTDPALTRRYWRHQKAGEKTFRSDWKKDSTYDLAHEQVGSPSTSRTPGKAWCSSQSFTTASRLAATFSKASPTAGLPSFPA